MVEKTASRILEKTFSFLNMAIALAQCYGDVQKTKFFFDLSREVIFSTINHRLAGKYAVLLNLIFLLRY